MPHSLFINKTNDSLKDDWEYGVGHSNPFKTPLEKTMNFKSGPAKRKFVLLYPGK